MFQSGDKVQSDFTTFLSSKKRLGKKGIVRYTWIYPPEDDRNEIPYCNVEWEDGTKSDIKERWLIKI